MNTGGSLLLLLAWHDGNRVEHLLPLIVCMILSSIFSDFSSKDLAHLSCLLMDIYSGVDHCVFRSLWTQGDRVRPPGYSHHLYAPRRYLSDSTHNLLEPEHVATRLILVDCTPQWLSGIRSTSHPCQAVPLN